VISKPLEAIAYQVFRYKISINLIENWKDLKLFFLLLKSERYVSELEDSEGNHIEF